MALKLVVDSLNDIPEALRSLYKEDGGKFRLEVDGVEDSAGLKSALEKERASARAYEKQVKQWQSLGKTPEEIGALLDEARKQDEKKALDAGQFEKLKQSLVEQHAAELKTRDARESSLRVAMEGQLIDGAAVRAISEAKGVPTLLLPHVKQYTKVVERDGQYQVVVVDAKGDPRINAKGDALSIADLVGEMRSSDVFGRAFDGTGAGGSGTRPNAGSPGSKTLSRSAFESYGPAEKLAAIKGGAQITD